MSSLKQTIRIIGGQYRGKKLTFPAIEGLRPTPDRVRETLFNWLMHNIRDARCLDAFAGSGALGFESFSRGASSVLLIEQERTAYLNLMKQAQAFNSSKLQVIQGDALTFLSHTKVQFDIIFLDPPFAKNYWTSFLNLLETTGVLVKGGLVYIEAPQALILNENTWQMLKLKQAGQVVYGLYQKL